VDGCTISFKKVPEDIKKIDTNNYKINFTKLDNEIPKYEMHNLEQSVNCTINYFRNKLNDFKK